MALDVAVDEVWRPRLDVTVVEMGKIQATGIDIVYVEGRVEGALGGAMVELSLEGKHGPICKRECGLAEGRVSRVPIVAPQPCEGRATRDEFSMRVTRRDGISEGRACLEVEWGGVFWPGGQGSRLSGTAKQAT